MDRSYHNIDCKIYSKSYWKSSIIYLIELRGENCIRRDESFHYADLLLCENLCNSFLLLLLLMMIFLLSCLGFESLKREWTLNGLITRNHFHSLFSFLFTFKQSQIDGKLCNESSSPHYHRIENRFRVILRDEGAKGNHFMLIGYFHVTNTRWACDFRLSFAQK